MNLRALSVNIEKPHRTYEGHELSEVEFESDAQRAAGVRDGPTVFAVITKKVFDEAVFVAAAARFLYKMTVEIVL